MPRLVLFNKPFQVLCQFSRSDGKRTLADYIDLPEVYPAGRLDYDSEGLLALTDDGRVQHLLTNPRHKLPKVYWAQVEGIPDVKAVQALRSGVLLKDGPARPAGIELMSEPALWPRHPPIRERRHIPTAWLQITLTEGRNRQVRRMTAAVGHPTLRLVRAAIGPWRLGSLPPGEWTQLPCPRNQQEIERLAVRRR